MTKAAENAQFYKGKRPLVDEYLQNAKQVEDIVSGRGHLYRPGFLGGMITSVERNLKSKLSDLNYDITRQAIERELAQTQFDYDLTYREARIAWELEKTGLLTALDQEFMDNKAVRELDKQQLDRLEISTNLRKLVIMAAKTAIDVDMEELRQEMTRVDQSTFPAEDALLAAKLLTANKKLEVIPYIETVLEKQQLIINAETANSDRKNALISEKEDLNDKRADLITAREGIASAIVDLIAAKESLVSKKSSLVTAEGLVAAQEAVNVGYLDQYIAALTGLSDVQQNLVTAKKNLIPYINNKSTALIAYAAELDAWVITKQAIATYKEQIAQYRIDRVAKKQDVTEARVELNDLTEGLKEARINLEIAKLTGRSSLMSQKITNAAQLLTERQNAFTSKLSRESDLTSKQVETDLYKAVSEFETMQEVNDIEIDAKVDSMERVVNARIDEREGVAAAASTAELTSELVHLLS